MFPLLCFPFEFGCGLIFAVPEGNTECSLLFLGHVCIEPDSDHENVRGGDSEGIHYRFSKEVLVGVAAAVSDLVTTFVAVEVAS